MAKMLRVEQLLLTGLLCILTAGPLAAQHTLSFSADFKNLPLDSVLLYIQKQTGFKAIYGSSLTRNLRPITYQQPKVPLDKMLDTVLGRLGLGYSFGGSFIRLHRDEQRVLLYNKADTLQGKVIDENGEPLGGVSVHNREKELYVITSHEGIFKLPWPAGSKYTEFSHVAYEKKALLVNNADTFQRIVLRPSFSDMPLQEVVVMCYYRQPSRRYHTASASHLPGEALAWGNSNPISKLSGKVPGLFITETSGAPGAVVRVQIRGRQSIGTLPGINNQSLNDPLILLNKIPLITGNESVTRLSSAAGDPQAQGQAGGISAMALLNPEDIESIEVLKDADATALYGTRGAHGAIFITTRSGSQGKPVLQFNIQRGAVTSTILPQLLDNRAYTAMRKEALTAAGMQPTVTNAPDLLLLDTNHYTNLPELLAGGTGKLTKVNVATQGGDSLLRYYLSSSYYRESSVMPASLPQQRFTSYAHVRYQQPGRRLQASLSMHYSNLHYQSIAADPMYSARLVPLLPSLRDVTGKLTWMYNGFSFINPLGQFATSNSTRINTFTGNFQGEYHMFKKLLFRANLGYQWLPVEELLKIPTESRNRAEMPQGEMATAHSRFRGIIAEPQLLYDHKGGDWGWSGLLGATFREERREWTTYRSIEYPDNEAPGLPGVEAQSVENQYTDNYRYYGVYARANMDWRKRYFLNATGRLDGSSRFAPRRKMAFFGVLGGTWIFSEENWIRAWQWLTFGKLRASYGTTGNDNIDNYGSLETSITEPGLRSYDGARSIYAKQRANPLLTWEKSRKLEIALELETSNGLCFHAAWYRNITSNQFIAEKIPGQADPLGFRIVNWPAKVLNTGWEFTLKATHEWHTKNSYTTIFVLSLPRNRLLAFPDIAATAYHSSLIIGQPLSVQRGLAFKGVDAVTGLFSVPAVPDTIIAGHLDPQLLGGWSQEWRLGRFRISLFLEARKQMALNPYYAYTSLAPGSWSSSQLTNQPRTVMLRWQQPGDQASLQRFTAANSPAVQQAIQYYRESDRMITNASFWRVRSLFLSWDLPGSWLRGVKVREGSIYLQGQNLFTGTPYRDGDPTILYPLKLPSLRTITAGLQIGF